MAPIGSIFMFATLIQPDIDASNPAKRAFYRMLKDQYISRACTKEQAGNFRQDKPVDTGGAQSYAEKGIVDELRRQPRFGSYTAECPTQTAFRRSD
jgi:hypothetical protein